MEYRPAKYVRFLIQGKDEEGVFDLWDSEELAIDGEAEFNRVYFGVRPSSKGEVCWNKEAKWIYLDGVDPSGDYFVSGCVDNMVIKIGE